jgi:undecaprenyl-diphosphatase
MSLRRPSFRAPRPTPLSPTRTVPLWRSPLLGNVLALCALLIVTVDRPISEAARELSPWILGLGGVLTDLGYSDGWLWGSGLLAIYLGWRRWGATGRLRRALTGWGAQASLFFFVAVAGSGIVTNLFKMLFGRSRPKLLDQEGLYTFHPFSFESDFHSFPSGHANTLVAVAVVLALFLPRYRVPLILAGLALALTRVVVNAHYLSDVVAGAALAAATTLWLRNACARRGWVFVLDRRERVRLAAPGRLARLQARRQVSVLWREVRTRIARLRSIGRPA